MAYCGLKKFIECFLENSGIDEIIEASFRNRIERRRFGINESGIIEYDPIYHEPINLDNQINYLSEFFNCKVETQEEYNDSESRNGGRPDDEKDYIYILILKEYDILEGDVIIYPVDSNKSYIVERDISIDADTKRYIRCYHDPKSTK